jgi:hypothetical protein
MKFPKRKWIATLLTMAVILCADTIKAQTKNSSNYTYYFEVTNVKDKVTAKKFEAIFKSKSNIERIQGYGLPRAFYILYAKSPLTTATVSSWVKKEWAIKDFKAFTITNASIVKLKTQKLLKKPTNYQ